MNIDECMEYAQKICDALTATERIAARAELRATIAATVATERERCAVVCEVLQSRSSEYGAATLDCAAAIRAGLAARNSLTENN